MTTLQNQKLFDNYSNQSMIMILKSLIDDINTDQINHNLFDCGPSKHKYPNIASLHFYNGICCIEKSPYKENLAVRKH
jgi:hypothetical protein